MFIRFYEVFLAKTYEVSSNGSARGCYEGFTRDVREDDEIRVPSHWNKLVTNLEC